MLKIKSKFAGVICAAATVVSLSFAALRGDVPATQTVDLPATQPAIAPSADVDKLIKQLGSDSSDERDAAQKQLVELGKSAAPKLKKAAEADDDPEIRSRASAALAQMKDRDDNDTSLITLHLKDAPAQDVMNAIGKQSKSQFIGYGTTGLAPNVAAHTVTIDADQKPFWDVMTDVCTQLNVCPVLDTPGHSSMRLFPVARNWMTQSPHQIVGPYWLSVAGVYRTRSIDLMGPQAIDDQFSIRLIVYPEPKLAVTQMSELKLLEVTDDAGNSLIPRTAAPAIVNLLRANRGVNHTVDARLLYPDQPGKKISLLRGEVVALLAQDMQRVEVDDVLGTPKVTNPLEHCTVKATVSKQGTEMFRVMLECTRDGLADDKWQAMMNRLSDISLEDADGHALSSLGVGVATSISENTFSGTCLFSRSPMGIGLAMVRGAGGAVAVQPAAAKTGDAKKLIWNVAATLKPVTIPVEFKDLPMP